MVKATMKRQIIHIALFALLYALCAGCGGSSTRIAGSRMADVYGDECEEARYEEGYDYNMVEDAVECGMRNTAWLSTSPDAHAYHIYEDCEALMQTVYPIVETDVDDAEGMGRHLCHYCAERLYCEEEGEDYEFEW